MTQQNQHIHNETCGVYKIRNLKTEELYIGCSKNVGVRWGPHVSLLRNNRHHSRLLQAAWNQYEECDFVVEIVEECKKSALIEREKYWIETLKPRYNGVGGTRGMDEEARQRMRKRQSIAAKRRGIPPAQQKKMREALRERRKAKTGTLVSKATRKRMSEAHRGIGRKLTTEKAREIKIALANGKTGKELASQYGVSHSVISAIKRGKLWRHA